jgi:hypothetical protein
MKTEYIMLAIVYGLVIVTAAVASIFLTFKGIRKWTSKRKVESKRRHLRIVK